jgi:hypothetical protein
MHTKISRRTAILGLGSAAALAALKGCGGGGGGGSSSPSPGGGGGDGNTSSMAGSIWYSDIDGKKLVKVGNGGLGTPTPVADIRPGDGRVSTFYPRISRKSPRYLQLGSYGVVENTRMLMQVYDHANHQPYCFVDVAGWSSFAYVSPSGNYIGMRLSPELVNDNFDPDATSIAGLLIVDISNPNTPRVVRDEYLNDGSAMMQFAWLDGDRFLYLNKNRIIVTGSAATGSASDQIVGPLDTQGLVSREFDVHPDGAKMLVTLAAKDGESYDVYLYDTTGKPIDRMTSTVKGYSPVWSPDGNHFMFKWGSSIGTDFPRASTCTGFYASASARNLGYADATQYDIFKVSCLNELYWSSIA